MANRVTFALPGLQRALRHLLEDESMETDDNYSWQQPQPPFSTPHHMVGSTYRQGLNEELARNDRREFDMWQTSEDSLFEEQVGDWIPSPELPEPCSRGYMSPTSPFALNELPLNMSFLDWFPKGSAIISYSDDLGDVKTVPGINQWIIEERSPLLAQAFEYSQSSLQLHLEAVTSGTVRPFLQFLYTGSYQLPTSSGQSYEDVPTSLLIHCQMYRLADIYDLAELRKLAYLNIIRQCEFGCSSPDKPVDLCAAIDYVYKEMAESARLIDTIVNYCVTCFLSHGLANDFEFRCLAYDLRPFYKELARVSMERGFEDGNVAQAIIQMEVRPYVPETYASRPDGLRATRCDDVVYHFHGCHEVEGARTKKKRREYPAFNPAARNMTLPLRYKGEGCSTIEAAGPSSSGDEAEGFTHPVREAVVIFEEPPEGIELLGHAPRELVEEQSSESEYEIVAGPAAVEDLSSESDSDADTLVVVDGVEINGRREVTLPFRHPSAASSRTAIERAGSFSDSEWDLV